MYYQQYAVIVWYVALYYDVNEAMGGVAVQ